MSRKNANLSATSQPGDPGRRSFLTRSSSLAMAGGLAASYGTFATMAGRFLFPAGQPDSAWQFVCTIDDLNVGQSLLFTTPNGATVVIARQAESASADAFIALSSVCPHLGCQVHWQSQQQRFYCPCHNGAFDSQGRATEGPPAKANQVLTRYPLRIENRLLYIEVALGGAIASLGPGSSGGHAEGQNRGGNSPGGRSA